jgi:hypothetical protein
MLAVHLALMPSLHFLGVPRRRSCSVAIIPLLINKCFFNSVVNAGFHSDVNACFHSVVNACCAFSFDAISSFLGSAQASLL